ncbi:hypothetical protein K438DRAFT_1985676 [Mycena galopus ATCC 62051]|nr:hypothetical protein K438DRAFT_1985676 [Mycena galopus ATCC 62051]
MIASRVQPFSNTPSRRPAPPPPCSSFEKSKKKSLSPAACAADKLVLLLVLALAPAAAVHGHEQVHDTARRESDSDRQRRSCRVRLSVLMLRLPRAMIVLARPTSPHTCRMYLRVMSWLCVDERDFRVTELLHTIPLFLIRRPTLASPTRVLRPTFLRKRPTRTCPRACGRARALFPSLRFVAPSVEGGVDVTVRRDARRDRRLEDAACVWRMRSLPPRFPQGTPRTTGVTAPAPPRPCQLAAPPLRSRCRSRADGERWQSTRPRALLRVNPKYTRTPLIILPPGMPMVLALVVVAVTPRRSTSASTFLLLQVAWIVVVGSPRRGALLASTHIASYCILSLSRTNMPPATYRDVASPRREGVPAHLLPAINGKLAISRMLSGVRIELASWCRGWTRIGGTWLGWGCAARAEEDLGDGEDGEGGDGR